MGGGNLKKKNDLLRERAEKVMERAKVEGYIPDSVEELVHELQVHQTELEMQNEELRETQEELSNLYNQYHEFYDEAPVGYFSLDNKGNVRNVNIKGAELLGLEKYMIIGFGFILFIPRNYQTKYHYYLKDAVVKREIQEIELQLKRGKSPFYVQMEIIPIHDKPDEMYRITIKDITERKQMEEKLKNAYDNLEDLVEERTTELRNAVEELEHSNQELQSFAYITSHDLQEPLRTMSSYAGLLKKRYEGQLDKDADDFLDYMVSGAQRMQDMIHGLLDYSRVGTHGGEFREFNSKEALNNALSNLHSAIEECHAEITIDSLPVINANEEQISRVFQNLIGNALKFHKKGIKSKIHISAEKEDKEYIFSVQDNGIGIEPQYCDKIFEVFKRLHAIGEYKGVGIGLAIVKRIIDHHGGRIWLESELGKGSTFYFTIPVETDDIVEN